MSQPLTRWGGSSQKIQIQDAKPPPATCSRFGGSGVCTPISHPHPNQPSRHRAMQIWVLLCIMSVCLSFPICKIRALPVIPGVRGHHRYVPEVSSLLPQRLSPTAQESPRVLGEKAVVESQVICSEPQSQLIQFHICKAVPARGRAEHQQSPLALSCILLLVPLSFPSQNQIKSLLLVPFLYTTPCTISE